MAGLDPAIHAKSLAMASGGRAGVHRIPARRPGLPTTRPKVGSNGSN